jgi:hypothetical protein
MTDPQLPQHDEQLEAYLDGLMNDAERAAFGEFLRNDPALRRQVDLQARIDGALEHLFHVEAPSREQIAAALAGAVDSPPTLESAPVVAHPALAARTAAPKVAYGSRTYWATIGLAAAAAIALVAASLEWHRPAADAPYFAARPLADVYRDAIASGFEPTYDCHEPERFAATFRQRQGQPLQLLAMSPAMRMMGLAYAGGLSRQTTAMLCRVDGEPVMVFVDRKSADQANAAEVSGTGLHVFRDEREGLVFYEVTPFDTPRVMQLLAPAPGGTEIPTRGA